MTSTFVSKTVKLGKRHLPNQLFTDSYLRLPRQRPEIAAIYQLHLSGILICNSFKGE